MDTPKMGRESAMHWTLRVFGLRRQTPRKAPSTAMLWLLASLCALGLALIVISDLHGFVNDLGVGLFGGCGGGWLRGTWDRRQARRPSKAESN
jgi:hypothetical protein